MRERDFLYLDLRYFRKKVLIYQGKEREFVNYFSTQPLVVFDNLESISKKTTSFKLLNSIKELREELSKPNIFISSAELDTPEESFFDSDWEKLYWSSPSQPFALELIKSLLTRFYSSLRLTESAIVLLSFLLGNNLKVLINRLLKLFLFLESFEYTSSIIDSKELKELFDELFPLKEKKELISYEDNSQLKAICRKKNFSIEEIRSSSRKKRIVFERDQIIYIMKEKLNFSVLDISRILLKSKSGVFYSFKKILRKREDETFRDYFDYLTKI
nr:helix-turn-helix domain-containing protein [Candidatus Mycoplasma haematolamae]